MRIKELRRIPMDSGFAPSAVESLPWLWNGFLLPGDITLLTSRWKLGKTTLLAGLLQALGTGTPFLNRPARPARAWIVSEESDSQWGERLRLMPLGPHVELLARPFRGRPAMDEWNFLIDEAVEAAVAEKLELVVIDPLASFLPGRCESDAGTLLEALQPLHRLTMAGVAVLLLHHPRKKSASPALECRLEIVPSDRCVGAKARKHAAGLLDQDDAVLRDLPTQENIIGIDANEIHVAPRHR